MVLAAFLVSLALAAAGLAVAVVRAVALWRQAKGTGRSLTAELAVFEERTARTERLLAEADRSSGELESALERLRVSRARLDVLHAELRHATARTRWLRAFIPV